MKPDTPSLIRGSAMGWLAAAFCVVVGFLEMSGVAPGYFGHPFAANTAFAYGMLSLLLLFLTWHYRLRGRACLRFIRIALVISLVYGAVMLISVFGVGSQAGLNQIIRLLFKLLLAWLVYSSIRFIAAYQPGNS